jgi:pimeloyl-ACP methyl ester carboxylesterase
MPFHRTRDGARLHYRLQGAGAPAMIFIHGWCSNLRHWEFQARHFARNHTVLRIDRRGMGRSTSPVLGQGGTAKRHAEDLARVARKHRIRDAIVVGHAGGGPTTLEFARAYPDLAQAVVLVDAGLYARRTFDQATVEAVATAEGFRTLYSAFFAPTCDPAVSERAIAEAIATPAAVAIDERRHLSINTQAIARQVRQPVLWVTATAADETYIASVLKDIEFGQVVGSGHFVPLEVPEQLNPMIESFLTRL